jgi:uncharacterized membrane protein HdeD (DUF308 family)
MNGCGANGYHSNNSRKDNVMGIGGGIALIVVGLVFLLHVIQVDIPGLNEYSLGIILVLGGIVAILLSLTIWRNAGPVVRRRGTTVVERRVEPGTDDPYV